MNYWILAASILCTLNSCSQSSPDDFKGSLLALSLQEKSINCQLDSMKNSIHQEWNSINTLLEENLPADMPEEEKRNMLKVRNASLIRMFESFESVDEQVKVALQEVEKKDRDMVSKITSLKRSGEQVASKKMELFEEIRRQEGDAELEHFRKMNQEILSVGCQP